MMRFRYFLIAVISLFACLVIPTQAHDIGVSKAELKENTDNSYRLRVISGPGASLLFQTPELPESCTFIGNPRGIQGGGWKTFEFTCNEALIADDSLLLPWQRDGVMLKAKWANASEVSQLFKNEAGMITVRLNELQAGSGSWQAAAKRYTVLGIEHILEGYDHLLFVLALMIIVSSSWMLIKTVTAFTVAHSITLALATLGFVNMPSRPVEAVIALSIVFLALEIINAQRDQHSLTYRAPWIVAFGFGLLHGFGFAGALSEIGLATDEIPVALLFFNIGVELGQLIFVASILILMLALKPIRFDSHTYMRALPAYIIGTISMYWLIERISGYFIV